MAVGSQIQVTWKKEGKSSRSFRHLTPVQSLCRKNFHEESHLVAWGDQNPGTVTRNTDCLCPGMRRFTLYVCVCLLPLSDLHPALPGANRMRLFMLLIFVWVLFVVFTCADLCGHLYVHVHMCLHMCALCACAFWEYLLSLTTWLDLGLELWQSDWQIQPCSMTRNTSGTKPAEKLLLNWKTVRYWPL